MVLSTPNPSALQYWKKAYDGEWTSDQHTCWVGPRQLGEIATRSGSGLVVTDVEYLRPSHALAAALFDRGRERAAAPTYIAVLEER